MMTETEFRAALAQMNMTQVGFARTIGVSGRSARRWAADGVPRPIELLLRLMLKYKIHPEALTQLAGPAPVLED